MQLARSCDTMDVLSYIALLATHLGFAGTLGALVRLVRAQPTPVPASAPVAFGLLIVLPSALALPLPPWLRYAGWLLGVILALAYSTRPANFPPWLWSSHFAYQYLGGLMLLILIWALANGVSPPHLLLGVLAAFAAGMALQRARVSS